MMGCAEEHETTVIGLTSQGICTGQCLTLSTWLHCCNKVFVIPIPPSVSGDYFPPFEGTHDVYRSGEVVKHVIQELGGKATRKQGPIPGINTKITSFLDPDGWNTVLVDNENFLKELS
ncbi:5'-adenylylsulfate reductase 1 [Hibiscus syriacus]|uniref:5'-adenylylsulfate reductase 1 n=1 Tax=Hibiscus syriacus TaxID=106335 RepID=A0A6A3AZK4_HIBSY|nr:5'-adenylylsulfate reductase 1 [Hibiscus syriacus]